MIEKLLFSFASILCPIAIVASVNNGVNVQKAEELVGGCYKVVNDHECDEQTGVATCASEACTKVPVGINTYEWRCLSGDFQTYVYVASLQTQCTGADPGTWGNQFCVNQPNVYCEQVQACESCVNIGGVYKCDGAGPLIPVGDPVDAKVITGSPCYVVPIP